MNPAAERLARLLAKAHGADPDEPEEAGAPWNLHQRPRWKGYVAQAERLLMIPLPQRQALVRHMTTE